MSNSFRREFGAYIRTRFPPWLALSLPLLLTVAAMPPSPPMTLLGFLSNFGLAVLLVFMFRLWDDITDRTRDQVFHPERVLCVSSMIQSFANLAMILAAFNMSFVLTLIDSSPATILILLYLMLAGWYWSRERLPWMPVLNYHIVLLKYPCFVAILGSISEHIVNSWLFNRAAVVYLLLCVFEALHDRQLRRFGLARVLMIVEFILAMLLIFDIP